MNMCSPVFQLTSSTDTAQYLHSESWQKIKMDDVSLPGFTEKKPKYTDCTAPGLRSEALHVGLKLLTIFKVLLGASPPKDSLVKDIVNTNSLLRGEVKCGVFDSLGRPVYRDAATVF